MFGKSLKKVKTETNLHWNVLQINLLSDPKVSVSNIKKLLILEEPFDNYLKREPRYTTILMLLGNKVGNIIIFTYIRCYLCYNKIPA